MSTALIEVTSGILRLYDLDEPVHGDPYKLPLAFVADSGVATLKGLSATYAPPLSMLLGRETRSRMCAAFAAIGIREVNFSRYRDGETPHHFKFKTGEKP